MIGEARVAAILVIDDDPNNLAIVSDYLKGFDFSILVAEDGLSGYDRALYARPDLILLDVLMPGIDGYETCRRLKGDERTRDIPVIFMTALAETEHKVKGFAAGAVDYITKPFQREEVLARVGVHLRIRELTMRLQEANELLERRVEERTAELRKSEEQLRQVQKMEAVGTLAGGVAHDFNNILTGIIGYATMLKLENPLCGLADDILAASERAANLTRSLLTFSRKQAISARPENLNDIVKRIDKLLLRIIGEDIELKTVFGGEDLVVSADAGQIEQVLMNLSANSRDAMPDGGRLTIATGRADSAPEGAEQQGSPGAWGVITVADTGEGMDEATRQRIFDPFFTTKEIGKGTGLGLSIVYGIVKQHGGAISVTSEPGKGTTFRIYLRLVQEEVQGGEGADLSPPKGGDETILVAEDDPDARSSMTRILEAYGYTVIAAADGEEAVAKFTNNWDRVHLVILDVVMPKKDGRGVQEALERIRDGIPVLYVSGHSADVVEKKGIVAERDIFLPKPLTPQLLLSKVREMLDKNRSEGRGGARGGNR